jgi:hypothetical protein
VAYIFIYTSLQRNDTIQVKIRHKEMHKEGAPVGTIISAIDIKFKRYSASIYFSFMLFEILIFIF